MSENIALTLTNVSKTFHVRENPAESIRQKVLGFFQAGHDAKDIKALKNINLVIKKGETVGIIGRNGSGKSTLLRLMMGTFIPDKGSIIETEGKIIKLSLGIGVNPNLSARDNIYVNGSILGLSFRKIGQIFHEIISFAGLEQYVDTPVKFYSSGMLARLNFSIAMYAEADIFLLDEFFGGVGDEDFKAKSDKVFHERIIQGRTNVIVSHSLNIIENYCSRVVWIDSGEIKMDGDTASVVSAYKMTA